MTSPRVFFYVQHLLGVGHIARASRIADAVRAAGGEITLAIGGMPVAGFPSPGTPTVQLPPVRSSNASFSTLVDEAGRPIDEEFKAARRAMLIEAFDRAAPDVLLIEAYPFGRRKLAFELRPLVEHAAARVDRPVIASSVRDIQQDPKPERVAEIAALVRDRFDLVLVHGDPDFVRIEETFPLAKTFADRVRYTGLVAAPPAADGAEAFDVVVSAGGGAAGSGMIENACEAARLLPRDLRILIITGPNLPAADRERFAASVPGNVRVEAFRTDFRALLAAARVSVSQAGYNTVCDLLGVRCGMILVPFTGAGETEQATRAARLADRGHATVLTEADLTGARLAEAVLRTLAGPVPERPRLDMGGAARTVEILADAVAERAGAAGVRSFRRA